jgi:hypothetical protein
VGNLQQRAVPLTHIAGLVHEDLLGTPAQRPGAWDTWLNIIAIRYSGSLLESGIVGRTGSIGGHRPASEAAKIAPKSPCKHRSFRVQVHHYHIQQTTARAHFITVAPEAYGTRSA